MLNNQILPNISAKHKGLFTFGIQALSLAPFSSLNSNARCVVANESTACSKIYRLVSKQKILNYFPVILTRLDLVRVNSLVNIDFSTFCGFETLAFGVQTSLGRAIPVWANCLTYPIEEVGSQNSFVISEIKSFCLHLGFCPSFVFDRGFWIPELIKYFLGENITFYLRIKQGKLLEWGDGKKCQAVNIGRYTKDATITIFDHKARLIVSPPPPKMKGGKPKLQERWYILTNDFDSEREEILAIYYHRFEIEETFKDLKHIFDLKKFLIKTKLTFRILLAFATLAFWLSYLCQKLTLLRSKTHPKKQRSYFRIWWEEIQRALREKSLHLVIPNG